VKLALHVDLAQALVEHDAARALYHEGQVDLLTPVVKAYCADQAFRIAEMAIQIYGGAGYVEDHPVEQYLRDAKIFSIYEGTNHIQALDLVARKLAVQGGEPFQALLREIAGFVAAHAARPGLAAEVGALGEAAATLQRAAGALLEFFVAGKLDQVTLAASPFLEILAEVTLAHLLLEAAVVAELARGGLDDDQPERGDFYRGKVAAAKYFVNFVLPGAQAKLSAILGGDRSPLDIPDAGFSAVR
jgi:Acetyl-CoA dehydrogenase C-terminal like/Acyl-CoA dehydrogenase, C-terminal domain